MFDTKTLKRDQDDSRRRQPDGIFFEPSTNRVYVLSHRAPHVTAINTADGKIAGTFDLGGRPSKAQPDGKGHAYICVEDRRASRRGRLQGDEDHRALRSGRQRRPAGRNGDGRGEQRPLRLLPAGQKCLVLDAASGKILATLPTGSGVDAAEFNPETKESFCSSGDGKLTVIKENSPTSFEVVQDVTTKSGAKCSTLDSKTGQIYLIAGERAVAAAVAAGPARSPFSWLESKPPL